MEKWREDAQPERSEAVGGFGRTAGDEDLGETRVLPLGGKPAGPAADPHEAGAGSPEDRWVPLGTFPGGDDRTRVLPDAAHRAEPPVRPGPRTGDTRGPAAPGRPAPFRSGPDGPWDTERTTVLRVPRDLGGTPGAQAPGPSSRPGGGPRPSDGPGAAGSPTAFRRPPSDPGTAVLPPVPGASVPGPGAPVTSRTPVRDPWQEEAGGSAEATHDPHEVTVQLDSVQIGEGLELRRAPAHAAGRQDAAGGPVFVDESGRRIRLYRRIGLAVGLACAGYAVVMVATLLSGSSDAPWMPVPGQEDKPAGQVETTPQPTGTDAVPGTEAVPGATPATGSPTPPAPGATAPAAGGTGGVADRPDAADPAATSAGGNPAAPSTDGDGDAATTTPDGPASPQPVDQPVSQTPDPVTTAPTGGGEADGTDSVAGAPADQPVVVADGSATRQDTSTTPTAPSPENVL
ncbi:hypothetical protein ABTY20_28045 [Streptomyces sp. NPDC126497]|uniref:hypothetical protein n=1 Tax=Streptomyces sp. NPDC126497 TaxID=3155313 RepID=UPI0033214EAA